MGEHMEDRIKEWVLSQVASVDGDTVPHLVVATRERVGDMELWNEYVEGSTHLVRFIVQSPGLDLVDGDDWWIRYHEDTDGGTIELMTEPDHPSYHGGELEEAIRWCNKLA